MRTLGKRVGDEPRGFESRPLRCHLVDSATSRVVKISLLLSNDHYPFFLTISKFSNTLKMVVLDGELAVP